MGPYLSRREIVAELGFPVWDEDGKTWFVAVDNGRVVGFCARVDDAPGHVFKSAYVLPHCRRHGIYRELFARRIDGLVGPISSTVTDAALPMFVAYGFTVTGKRGRYNRVVRHV